MISGAVYRPRLPKAMPLKERKKIHNRRKRERSKQLAKSSPERRRARNLKKKYGICWKAALTLYQRQDGKCAICESSLSLLMTDQKSVACLDHCHSSGAVRGFLCSRCNAGLGSFRDTPELLHKAINYLQKFNQ